MEARASFRWNDFEVGFSKIPRILTSFFSALLPYSRRRKHQYVSNCCVVPVDLLVT